jgi:hypothetical protein
LLGELAAERPDAPLFCGIAGRPWARHRTGFWPNAQGLHFFARIAGQRFDLLRGVGRSGAALPAGLHMSAAAFRARRGFYSAMAMMSTILRELLLMTFISYPPLAQAAR